MSEAFRHVDRDHAITAPVSQRTTTIARPVVAHAIAARLTLRRLPLT